MQSRRSIALSIALILLTIAAGAAVRFARLGMPFTVVKYGGSALWAMAIYWMASTITGRRWLAGVLLAGGLATGIEFFKLYHSPTMDAFRGTLPGVLVLGRYFSVWDLLAYWVAIGVGAAADWGLRSMAEDRRHAGNG
jgi:hypothetical protein